jgi:hypothetical protein
MPPINGMVQVSEAALAILTEILSSPIPVWAPSLGLCPVEATGALQALANRRSEADGDIEEGYWKRKSAALDVTTSWLLTRRTCQEVDKVLETTCECDDDIKSTTLHQLDSRMVPPSVTPGAFLVRYCTMELYQLLEQAHKSPKPGPWCEVRSENPVSGPSDLLSVTYPTIDSKHFRKYRLYHLSARKTWPNYLPQLLPHGPEQSILGYMDWLVADDYSGAGVETMHAFVIILGFAWPCVVPVLLRTSTPKHDAEGEEVLLKYFVDASKSWTSTLIKMAAVPGVEAKFLLGTHAHRVSGMLTHFAMAMRIIYAECTDFTAASYFLER